MCQSPESKKWEKKLTDFRNSISEQIKQEENLISNRLSWMLTFQGFLFTALTWIGRKDAEEELKEVLMTIIPLIGMLTSYIAIIGIIAAYFSINNIKKKLVNFKKEIPQDINITEPPPAYGTALASLLGRIPSHGVPLILVFSWFWIEEKLINLSSSWSLWYVLCYFFILIMFYAILQEIYPIIEELQKREEQQT